MRGPRKPRKPVDLAETIRDGRQEREAELWEGLGLSHRLPPYDWGDLDPETLGSPVKHLPGGAFVVDPVGEERWVEDLPVAELFPACRKLGNQWHLPPREIAGLLGTSRSTWARWIEAEKQGHEPRWSPDQRARALALLRIFEAVGDLHQKDEYALTWPHEALLGREFGGRTPLEVMASGIEGIFLIRDYLNFLLAAQT